MTFYILTLFPEIFESVFEKSIIKRAASKKLIKIKYINIRDFGTGTHKMVDDTPYGGGQGMVMKVDVLANALKTIKPKPFTVLLSAGGKKYNQKKAQTLSKKKNIAIICGHYEGVDARVENFVDEVLSIGDYILTGGEIPAMLLVDSITRLLPGSLNPKSPKDESFEKGILEYPQYTRPEVYKGQHVPKVLLLGNHAEIKKWRSQQALQRTKEYRPDLLKSRQTKRE